MQVHVRATAVGVGLCVAVTLVLASALMSGKSPSTFVGNLTGLRFIHGPNCGPGDCPAVELTLEFSSPTSISAVAFVIHVADPNVSYRLLNGSLLTTFELHYSANLYPHWLVTSIPNVTWTGFTAKIVNPNGHEVGGPTSASYGTDESILSSAQIVMTFPLNTDPNGSLLEMTVDGATGAAEISVG